MFKKINKSIEEIANSLSEIKSSLPSQQAWPPNPKKNFIFSNIGTWLLATLAMFTFIAIAWPQKNSVIERWEADKSIGPVQFMIPSDFIIIRGAKLHFPSDHFSFPLMLSNQGGL